jgi:hypothetical protein
MTLTEQVAKAEAQGKRLLGFYVAGDVYAALCKAGKRSEQPGQLVPVIASELAPMAGALMVVVSEMIPQGHIAPFFSDSAPKAPREPWSLDDLVTRGIEWGTQHKSALPKE